MLEPPTAAPSTTQLLDRRELDGVPRGNAVELFRGSREPGQC